MSDRPKIISWVAKQKELHALGLLTLYRKRRLENLPNWTWRFGDGKNVSFDKNGWYYDCGWYAQDGKIEYQRFLLGQPWLMSNQTSDNDEKLKVKNLIDDRWRPFRDVGWTITAIVECELEIRKLIDGFKKYSVSDLIKLFRTELTARIQHETQLLKQFEKSPKGRETIERRLKGLHLQMRSLSQLSTAFGKSTSLGQIDNNAIDSAFAKLDEYGKATATDFLLFCRRHETDRTNDAERNVERLTLDQSGTVDGWISKRLRPLEF